MADKKDLASSYVPITVPLISGYEEQYESQSLIIKIKVIGVIFPFDIFYDFF
jgi:hypothetical protein